MVVEDKRIEQEMCKEFYVYLYLDPRKMGEYRYGDDVYSFEWEPFYVGKGKDGRKTDHLNEAKRNYTEGNQLKLNVIRKIWKEGLEPIIIVYKDNLTEDEAIYQFEIPMIAAIGRRDKKLGPLTNLTDGGEGVSGYVYTEERKRIQSINLKKFYENPANKEKQRQRNIETNGRPEVRLKNSISTKRFYENPENRKKASEIQKEVQNRPEVKEKVRLASIGNKYGCHEFTVFYPNGDEIICSDIPALCEKYDLTFATMSAIRNGATLVSHKGFRCCRVGEEEKMKKLWAESAKDRYCVIDPTGKVYRCRNLAGFSKDKGLDPKIMAKVARGDWLDYNGWKAIKIGKEKETLIKWMEFILRKRVPKWIFTDSEDKEYRVPILAQFCKEHDLNENCIQDIIRGRSHQHRGWKVRRI